MGLADSKVLSRQRRDTLYNQIMSNALVGIGKADVAEIDALAINTIRTLSMDAVQAANSGHPGTPMALAPVAYTLWQHFLRYDPEDPMWPNRDRFVLSNGHASMLLPRPVSDRLVGYVASRSR